MAVAILAGTVACGDDHALDPGGTAATGASGGGASTGGMGGESTGAGGAGGSGGAPTGSRCDPLPSPRGAVVEVAPGDDLATIVADAQPGTTVRLAAGTYDLTGSGLWIGEGVTLRGQSDDPAAVVLEGGYDTAGGGLVNVRNASGVTIADLTIQHPRYHAIHVTAIEASANDVRIHRVRIFDPGEQAIKINHGGNGYFADDGEVACSHIELTPAGRTQVMGYTSSGSSCYTGGVDGHGARDWVVRDNFITGFWCDNADLSEHGVHFWTGSRDTVVIRNRLVDNARAIGFGMSTGGRTYTDDPCGGITDANHYGGFIANNFIAASDPALFASPNGMDSGISLWHACGAVVVHNTVASTAAPFSSIEWRFDDTTVHLVNNLVSHVLRERDGATADAEGNLEGVTEGYVDVTVGDLHLEASSPAIGQGDPAGATLAPEDFDGDPRPASPDVGADQR